MWVEGDRDFETAMSVRDMLQLMAPRKTMYRAGKPVPCIPAVFWNGSKVGLDVDGYLDQSLRNLEGIEIYRDYFAVPAAIRFAAALSVRHVRECGLVILWVKRPDFPRR